MLKAVSIIRNTQEFFRCFLKSFHSYAGIVPQLGQNLTPTDQLSCHLMQDTQILSAL